MPGLRPAAVLIVLALAAAPGAGAEEAWRGIPLAPEARCAPYDRGDYRYPQSVEREVADAQGGIFGPYTGRCYASLRETQIEHVVALSEAHDSGLCAAGPEARRRFARDIRNLALARPDVNRRKGAHDAAGWLPDRNRCWFADRVVEVRRAWGLTIDRAEADALEAVLAECESTRLVPADCAAGAPGEDAAAAPAAARAEALRRWDDNGNGRITCAEARRHGIAPVPRGHPAYPFMRDGDGDGVVCE